MSDHIASIALVLFLCTANLNHTRGTGLITSTRKMNDAWRDMSRLRFPRMTITGIAFTELTPSGCSLKLFPASWPARWGQSTAERREDTGFVNSKAFRKYYSRFEAIVKHFLKKARYAAREGPAMEGESQPAMVA